MAMDLSQVEVELTIDVGYGTYALEEIASPEFDMPISYEGEKLMRVNGEPYAWGIFIPDGFKITRLYEAEEG